MQWVYKLLLSGQISIIPKPELRGFGGSSLIKPPFRVTSADVVIICPAIMVFGPTIEISGGLDPTWRIIPVS